ncbi:MAG: ubiquinone anaerobic biosynthesis accessory factor UbiT [Halorhodospira sp.]
MRRPHLEDALPLFLAPLRLVPGPVNAALVPAILQQVLADALADGELEILADRVLALEVTDARLAYGFTLRDGRLATADPAAADVTIRGDAAAFLALAGGAADPDMLFFRRRLSVEGDVALGLSVKNLLESYEPRHRLPGPLCRALEAAAARVKV